MIKRIITGASAFILGVGGVAFAASYDYSGWEGDTSREVKQIEVVKDSLRVIGECRLEGDCNGGGGEFEQINACTILLNLAYGKGECRRKEWCTIEREEKFLLEGGLIGAVNVVCDNGEGDRGGQVDDASALCSDNPAGRMALHGPMKSCAVHGFDQP